MLKSKSVNKICILAICLAALFTILFPLSEQIGLQPASKAPGYSYRLFDDSKVHNINIELEDAERFFADSQKEEYVPATVTVDGESFYNVGVRTKGNNSLHLTEKYGLSRFSLKLEFDRYSPNSYHGLDKFSLDSSFQDNSYLKSYMTYDMMHFMGVPAPLVSYTRVSINNKPYGLFLAIEEPEEAFAKRNFGPDYGQLYKPAFKNLDDENADVALRYTGEDLENYDNIFRKAKFKPSTADKERVIEALRILSTGENLEQAVDVDEVLRFMTVQSFVVNLDSYLGKNGHNYFLYEEDGILQMLPWDYNLAYGTYSLGMPDPTNDVNLYVNHPIDSPASEEILAKRPMFTNLMANDEYYLQYHRYYDQFIRLYFESGYFETKVARTTKMIAPYVKEDPTAYISYEDYLLGVDTFCEFNLLRAESVRGQLNGSIPSTFTGQETEIYHEIDGSHILLEDLGEIDDLKNAYNK